MKLLILKSLEDFQGEIIFEPQEEDLNIFEQFEEEDTAQAVANQYNSGNRAAWFCAKVSVKYKGFEATDYLGGCSYKSFKEFKQDAYYSDMVSMCTDEINKEIADHNADIQKRWNIRKAKNLIAPYDMVIVSKTCFL